MSDINKVDPMDPGKRNSPIAIPADEDSTVMLDGSDRTCTWNDRDYAEGDQVCDAGTTYECSFGKWVKTDSGC